MSRQNNSFNFDGPDSAEQAQTVLSNLDTETKEIDQVQIEYSYTNGEEESSNASADTDDISVSQGAQLHGLVAVDRLGDNSTHDEIADYAVNELGYTNKKTSVRIELSALDDKGLIRREKTDNGAYVCSITERGKKQIKQNWDK